MASLDFEGRAVPIQDGDTVGSALFRAGVRTFNRSLKYHRPRGLYCATGDCPNCIVTVDGRPGVRACTAQARAGQRVRRATGWPSADRDLLAVADRMHRLLPVGFYSKTFIRPRFAWPVAERVIRRATGVGHLPVATPPVPSRFRYRSVDVLVIGGGVAGLAAAAEAATAGATVVCCDESMLGAAIPAGPARERIDALAAEARGAGAEVLERTTAVGIYEGGQVPLVGDDETIEVDAERIVAATGAVGAHAVFRENDVPGVWLGRGAARLAGVHGVPPATRVVVLAGMPEAVEHVRVLRDAGVAIEAVVRVPDADLGVDAAAALDGLPVVDGTVGEVLGAGRVAGVRVVGAGGERTFPCDGVVVSVGLAPRDGLLRMSGDEPVIAAGDAALPGCSVEEAEASGRAAARGEDPGSRPTRDAHLGEAGYVCLCEDVGVTELAAAWEEGWRSSEILKRYTTTTMGPCQGAVCGRQLARFVAERRPTEPAPSARTTARPPARAVPLESLIGGVDEVVEKRTALHDRHVASGGHVHRSGSWLRPYRYGRWEQEYEAVRSAVGAMDVGTLGKFLIAGADASALVDDVFPCRTDDLELGRSRYVIALDEAGYVMDDGLLCAVDDGRYYLTSTSGGAERMEAWLRDRADRLSLRAHVVDRTHAVGAILVAGPAARQLLDGLADGGLGELPHMRHTEMTVAGVPCRAIRSGFVGEFGVELHHPASRSDTLWAGLIDAGDDLGIRPFGLDALDVLRLEKGHIYLGQDTLPDDHPDKLGLGFAVAAHKPSFVGKTALARMRELPLERKLVGLRFDGVPQRGAPLEVGGRIVGRVTSCARSRVLGSDIGLGWLRTVDGVFPEAVRSGTTTATVVRPPFYDPEGARLRG